MKAAVKKKAKAIAQPPKAKAKPKNHRAVMASRREPPDSLEFFPTPPWATRSLCELVLELDGKTDLTVWEPAAGEGHMAEVLREYFAHVHSSDVFDYGRGYDVGAFVIEKAGLVDDLSRCPFDLDPDWIISNPPFSLAEYFVIRALMEARVGVAMLVPLRWLETLGRFEKVFRDIPPTKIAIFVERVPLTKGCWDPDADTATSYVWVIWEKKRGGRTDTIWIPPGQRVALTKPDDARRFGPNAGDDLFEAKGE